MIVEVKERKRSEIERERELRKIEGEMAKLTRNKHEALDRS